MTNVMCDKPSTQHPAWAKVHTLKDLIELMGSDRVNLVHRSATVLGKVPDRFLVEDALRSSTLSDLSAILTESKWNIVEHSGTKSLC